MLSIWKLDEAKILADKIARREKAKSAINAGNSIVARTAYPTADEIFDLHNCMDRSNMRDALYEVLNREIATFKAELRTLGVDPDCDPE